MSKFVAKFKFFSHEIFIVNKSHEQVFFCQTLLTHIGVGMYTHFCHSRESDGRVFVGAFQLPDIFS